MNVTEVNQTHTDAKLQPVYIRIPEACRIFALSRTKLYQLIKERKFKSVSLAEPGQTRATRLIHYASLVQFLDSQTDTEGAT